MKTEILRTDHPIALNHAQDVLNHGGLVAFPTDTVYGMAASLDHPQAVEGLFLLKGQGSENAVALLIGSSEWLPRLVQEVPEPARRLVERFWPGPLTLLLRASPKLLPSLRPHGVVGVRMPAHPFALELLRRTGPLAVTAANLIGEARPRSATEVLKQFDGRLHLVLNGGLLAKSEYSTVVDCTRPEVTIARQGPIREAEIFAALA
jgi:tRNA threonylcarbamoyl adenosine modification protein (Sua5/YciO/YrdC/YwlC family)